jgi:hypothetical protein
MQGVAMAKNVRRVGIPATRRGKPNPDYPRLDDALDRRLRFAEGHYTVGDDKQGGKIHTMRDQPLDRMFARQAITGAEYAALQKYHHHWHHAGLEMSLVSADLNRVFASDPGSLSGMAKTEAQAHHRKQWRDARASLGLRTGIVVDNVVCAGHSLEVAGFSIGWSNKPQAIAAATEAIRDAGYRLAKLWGIG